MQSEDFSGVLCDRPWARLPDYEVFRHPENNKWFALAAEIPKTALTESADKAGANVSVVNLKIDP